MDFTVMEPARDKLIAEVTQDKLITALKSTLASGAYSDLTIACQDSVFHVHKVIICSQSDFFDKAVSFSAGKEAEDSRVDLSADDPETIKLLVQFFYEAEYNPFFPPPPPLPLDGEKYWSPQTEPHWCKLKQGVDCIEGGQRDGRDVRSICEHHECGGNYCDLNCDGFVCEDCLAPPREFLSEQLLTHIKVYIVADKYNVVALKDLAIEKFKRSCWSWWDNPNFPIAAQFAHRNAPAHDSRLREVIQETIFIRSELLDNPEIETLLTEWPGLAMRILKKTVQMKVPEVPKSDELSSSEIEF